MFGPDSSLLSTPQSVSEDEMFQRLMEQMRSAELEGIDVVEKLWSSTYRNLDMLGSVPISVLNRGEILTSKLKRFQE